jgi:hypothetical protein
LQAFPMSLSDSYTLNVDREWKDYLS